jgi:hypothetical protein
VCTCTHMMADATLFVCRFSLLLLFVLLLPLLPHVQRSHFCIVHSATGLLNSALRAKTVVCTAGTSSAGLFNFRCMGHLENGFKIFLVVLNACNIVLWLLSLVGTSVVFGFANCSFRNTPQAHEEVHRGQLANIVFSNMFSARDPSSNALDGPPAGTCV